MTVVIEKQQPGQQVVQPRRVARHVCKRLIVFAIAPLPRHTDRVSLGCMHYDTSLGSIYNSDSIRYTSKVVSLLRCQPIQHCPFRRSRRGRALLWSFRLRGRRPFVQRSSGRYDGFAVETNIYMIVERLVRGPRL